MDQPQNTQPTASSPSQSSVSQQSSTPAPKKSPVLAIVVIIIVVLLLGAGAYFVFIAKNIGSSAVSKVAPISSSCKYNDPDLCKFVNGWKDVKYFTLTSTSTFEGKEIKMTMKSVGTDKTQLTSSQGGTENMDVITIGSDTYTKDYSDSKWVKTTSTPSEDETTIKDELSFDTKADQTEDKTTYKKIGMEACGKLTCFKYQVLDPAITDSIEYILFDNKQYQLRKTISIGKDSNQAISEFDYAKISIDVPSPIKESASVPTTGSVPSQEDVNRALEQIQSGTSSTDASRTDTSSTDTSADDTQSSDIITE